MDTTPNAFKGNGILSDGFVNFVQIFLGVFVFRNLSAFFSLAGAVSFEFVRDRRFLFSRSRFF